MTRGSLRNGMDIKALECFIALIEEKYMKKAAERMFITQQGLSRIIINLEKELGCSLFERKRAGMIPTPEGERLYETAKRVTADIDEMRRDMGMLRPDRPVLKIICKSGTLPLYLPALVKFGGLHPEIDLRWEECFDEECLSKPELMEADLALDISAVGRTDRQPSAEMQLFQEYLSGKIM